MLIYAMTPIIINPIFKTGPRATNVVLAGDLVPPGTLFVTPAVSCKTCSSCFSVTSSVLASVDIAVLC